MTVHELREILSNEAIHEEVSTQPVELEMEEEMLIQVLKDIVETSWGRDTIDSKTIYGWLANFDGSVFLKEYERKLALILAIHMVFYNENDICYLVKIAYRKLIHDIMIKEGKTIEDIIKSTIFCPLGSVSESGPFLSYYFRKENNLSTDFFINSAINIANSSDINNIVFLDDVSISGGQVSRYINQLKKESIWNKLFEEKNLSTINAKRKLKEKGICLCAPILMDERSQCFKKESAIYKIFEDNVRDIIRIQTRYMTQVYGYRLLINQYSLNGELQRMLDAGKTVDVIKEKIKKDALGYNDSEMLIAFEYNTPNNCLPIIWVESNDWIPLFKRNDKLYTLQVVGGIKDESIYI